MRVVTASQYLLVLVSMACASGCASTPVASRSSVYPPAPLALPSPRASLPADPNLPESPTRREAAARELVIVPFAVPGAGPGADPDDPFRALTLAQVLQHAIENDHDLYPRGLAIDLGLYGSFEATRAAVLAPTAALPPELARTHYRYVLGGRLERAPRAGHASGDAQTNRDGSGLALDLWLMDRDTGLVHRKRTEVDLPRLFIPRLALASLLGDAGLAPSELQRADMVWYEDLSDAALVAVGKGLVHARFGLLDAPPEAPGQTSAPPAPGPALRDPVALAEEAAPWSYTAAILAAGWYFTRAPSCDATAVARYNRAMSLHRSLPFALEAYVISCEVAGALDPNLPPIPAWTKRADATCRIGGKGLTSVGVARGDLGGGTGFGREAGFVTGLGGIYRGDTCEAAMANDVDDTTPPFTRAALALEAAFYSYSNGDLRTTRRWFARASGFALGDPPAPAPHCLLSLLHAEARLGLADLAVEEGDEETALPLLAEAEAIATRCLDPRMEGRIHNSRGLLAQARSRLDEALEHFAETLRIFTRLGDEMNLAVVLTNLGVTWLHLGRFDKAVPLLEQALAGKERVRSRGGTAVLLENLGVAALAGGDGQKAEGLFERALEYARDAHTRATLHVQLARLALARGKLDVAKTHMDEANELSTKVHARVLRAVIEQVEATAASTEGRFAEALRDFHSALAIRRELGDRMGEGITLSLLMQVALRMKEPALAILYGKLAVAAHEEVRQAASAIDRDTAREFVASRASTYRALGGVLVEQGRLIEAERVLALLKEDEVRQWTRDTSAASGAMPLTTAERELDQRYRTVADRVMELGREHAALAAKPALTPAEGKHLESLRTSLEAANGKFVAFLATLAEEGQRLAKSRTLESLREDMGIGPDLGDLGPGHVAVYTLLGADALHLIVVSKDAQVARTVRLFHPIDSLIATYREALQSPDSDPRPAAQALYDLLIGPIEKDLVQARATTILWSLDHTLRYAPLAALHDGKRYAIERWAMAVFTPASHARLKDAPNPDWRVLGLGVTKAHPPFGPLPAVADELRKIVDDPATTAREGALPGFLALDEAFSKKTLLEQLGRRWPVVHLASHFAFVAGDKDASHLLLGDGSKLTVTELERLPNLFAGVDLLTLSACNTATGDIATADGTEVESFAVLAQRKGARAVFASLWPVADNSTSWLMARFYGTRSGTKLESLRRAQLDMLNGQAGENARHPYYWAPFVLVGNTR